MNKEKMEKLHAVWKPKGVSSNGFLNRIRKLSGIRKIGHSGTLDPLAEGVLVIGIGKGTKLISGEGGAEKEYEAIVRLGASSTTDDEEGEKTEHAVTEIPRREDVETALSSFIGVGEQIPPIYSAIKIKGKEAYKLARSGKEVEMVSRKAEIKEAELISYEWPFVSIRVVTGPGVYIRAMARDLGEKLGTGGYLSGLKRTRVGDWSSDKITPLEYFSKPSEKDL
jgi:tRNA pseudouridine55 synthase